VNENASERKRRRSWYWLLLLPFIGTLWPPFFASAEPHWGAFPFFYWYLFVWVIISATLTWVVYRATEEKT